MKRRCSDRVSVCVNAIVECLFGHDGTEKVLSKRKTKRKTTTPSNRERKEEESLIEETL